MTAATPTTTCTAERGLDVKKIERSNFRVEFNGTIHLGVSDGPVAALASRVAVAGSIDPRRLGDFGFMSMSDRLASRGSA
jgi:hypothetical protein